MKNQEYSVRQLFGCLGTVAMLLLIITGIALAQTTAFTYQGKLTDNGTPASGNYDLTFKLFDTVTVGSGVQQGATLNLTNVAVSGGVFTVTLDFGACNNCFNGSARFLEFSVKPSSGSTFTTLTPRQAVTATPYALKSMSAAAADGLSVTCVSCVTSSQIQSVNGSVVSGAIPVASVPAGSTNYIQNTMSQQATSNFNISGSGTAGDTLSGNIVNATSQYNLNGLRAFTVNGAFDEGSGLIFTATNTFTGDGAGVNTTPSGTLNNQNGKLNSFYGAGAGQANTTGFSNSFFGTQAGLSNTTGVNNAFFGKEAGRSNTDGVNNSFFGKEAGRNNTIGLNNAFFGYLTGGANTTGDSNSFFGQRAGRLNTTGDSNVFFGLSAGLNNITGSQNTFIGTQADFHVSNPTGNNNTLLGYNANVNSGVSNSTAIGVNASVTQSNSLVLGSIFGVNGATTNANVGIGTTAPVASLHIESPSANSIDNTARFAAFAIGPNTSHIHYGTTGDWYIRSASSSGNIIMQDSGGNVGIGTNAPADKLVVIGAIRFSTLGAAGSTTLCRNSTFQISSCSSSRRYKENIADWHSGLNLINRLRPVTFDWKESKAHDLGLVAEEVAEVEPLLVTHNDKGEIEGVKYDRLGVVLVNAIKEQQAQVEQQQSEINHQHWIIEQQQQQFARQQKEINNLKMLIGSFHPKARRHK